MKKYEVQVQVNSWAFVELEAENEDEARELAERITWNEWKLDTDYANIGEVTVTEVA